MITWKKGKVIRIIDSSEQIQELEVECEGTTCLAWNYPSLSGEAVVGDLVYLNTTAVQLKLGTGGYHFVIANLSRIQENEPGPGHIMKLRYTPYQLKVLSVEEEESPYHDDIKEFTSLEGTPVVVGTLHSMLAPAAAGCVAGKEKELRVVYVMTDGAALPLPLSRMVRTLKKNG